MTRRLPFALAFACALPVVGIATPASAQSSEILGVESWNVTFSYSADSSFEMDGQTFDYTVTVSGDALLERSEDSPGPYFAGDPNLTISLQYSGSAISEDGCGLVETVSSASAAPCDRPSSLYLDETSFDFELGCELASVMHEFEWQGSCGELFPYPVDGEPLTEWPWQAPALALDGTSFRTAFDYPATGTTLRGNDAGELLALLQPLFTAIATGTGAPMKYSFDFTITPASTEELELIIDAPDYLNWRPSVTRAGDPGEFLELTARLQTADGDEPDARVERFTWELAGTSSEPGFAMNYPRSASDSELDLRLRGPRDGSHEISGVGQIADQLAPEGFTDTILVDPFDWGGWSTLSVTAYLADGRSVTGKLEGAAESGARLPKREKDSLISDFWKDTHGASGVADDADEDGTPEGDGTPGDGLTLYEEYRGLYDGYRHVEGDPDVKDFFVLNRPRAATVPGILRFKTISGLNVHFHLTEEELPDSKIINANRSAAPSVTDQHAVVMDIDPAYRNFAKAIGGPGNPKMIQRIALMSDWKTMRVPDGTSGGDYFALVVAHELFHSVNVYHHGDVDKRVAWRVVTDAEDAKSLVEFDGRTQTPIIVLNEKGDDRTPNEIAFVSEHGGLAPVILGVDTGQHSGDDGCVMRYTNSEAYVSRADPGLRYVVTEVPGFGLCQTPAGVGVNDPGRDPQSRYDAAANLRGICSEQILVNDAVEAPNRCCAPPAGCSCPGR